MPIPWLLVGLGAAALGLGGHADAKETNEKAQRISEEAQQMYNSAKNSLEIAQSNTEKALLNLGYKKKNILDSSMHQFVDSFEKIKHIQLKESVGIHEVSKFSIDSQAIVEVRKMTDIYSSTIKSGATGAAAGAIVALAASGSLPIVTGSLATAGSILMTGEIGLAAGLAGSALSFGAAMTPLSAIAAPVVLFTGISASIKADENLEKARTMYAEAELAVEQMETSKTLCNAIAKRSEMFEELLVELNGMFSECTKLFANVIKSKGAGRTRQIVLEDFSEDEQKLIAVTRSLAGAVKAVIDTPILSKDGDISTESTTVYNQTRAELADWSQNVNEIRKINYEISPQKECNSKATTSKETTSNNKFTAKDWIILIILAVVALFLFTQSWFWVILIGYIIYRKMKK